MEWKRNSALMNGETVPQTHDAVANSDQILSCPKGSRYYRLWRGPVFTTALVTVSDLAHALSIRTNP